MVDDPDELESDKAAAEKNGLLRGLTAHPGWQILRDIAESQILMRTNHIVLTQLSPEFTSSMQEYEKGEVQGMRSLLAIPGMAKEALREEEEIEASRTPDEIHPESGEV